MLKSKNVFIIAEAGVNHNGKLSLAKELARKAKKAGADAVKFQTWITEDIIIPKTKKPIYQMNRNKKNNDQFNFAKKLELSFEEFVELKKFCKKTKITFLSTPDDVKSAKFLNKIQNIFKIGSPEFNNFFLIKEICKFNKLILLSTGLSSIKEISETINFLKKINFDIKKKLILMHCNSAYPTPYRDVNLLALPELKKKFNVEVGYSDHTNSDEVSIAAVALGAKVIEKHFTLNKNMSGPDHSTSLDYKEFSNLVKKIRNIELSLGSKIKKITPSASKNLKLMTRGVYASKIIIKNEKFNTKNISIKRPKNKIAPRDYLKLLGKKSRLKYEKHQSINKNEI